MLVDELQASSVSKNLVTRVAAVLNGSTAAEPAARAIHKLLIEAATDQDFDPLIEVMIRAPGEPRHIDDTDGWVVAWESGPDAWAEHVRIAVGSHPSIKIGEARSFGLQLSDA